jgi:hypothetical protein
MPGAFEIGNGVSGARAIDQLTRTVLGFTNRWYPTALETAFLMPRVRHDDRLLEQWLKAIAGTA